MIEFKAFCVNSFFDIKVRFMYVLSYGTKINALKMFNFSYPMVFSGIHLVPKLDFEVNCSTYFSGHLASWWWLE